MNSSPTIRAATPSDEAAVFSLATQLSPAFAVERPVFSASFAAMFNEQSFYLYVAENSGSPVAYLLGWSRPTFYANGPVAWVQEIVVQPSHRRSGIGQQLMAHFEAWSVSRGCRVISLASRGAGDFYKAIGYTASEATYYKKTLI